MKKIIIILLLGIFLLGFSSCTDENTSYSIKDALKISAYLYNEDSGEDYFVRNEFGNYDYNREEGVFELEQLKLNEERLMNPLGFNMLNLNLHFEFDGIIEVISEDKNIQLFFNNKPYVPITGTDGNEGGNAYGFEMKLLNEGYIAANPLGSNRGDVWRGDGTNFLDFYIGREYYLNVNAYKFDNEQSPIIKARLKLVMLEDIVAKYINDHNSCCFSIEMISYDYSDIYKLLDEIVDDD